MFLVQNNRFPFFLRWLALIPMVLAAAVCSALTVPYGDYQASYDLGYEVGYEQGFPVGFVLGEEQGGSAGTSEGNSIGNFAGWSEAYVPAYEASYEIHFPVGYSEGYTAGFEPAFDEGYGDGAAYIESLTVAGTQLAVLEPNGNVWTTNTYNDTQTHGLVLTSGVNYYEPSDFLIVLSDYVGTNEDEAGPGEDFFYNAGLEEGESVGEDDGFTAGYSTTYDLAFEEAYAPAFQLGLVEGLAEGTAVGSVVGYDAGLAEGFSVGDSEGYASGYDDGLEESWDSLEWTFAGNVPLTDSTLEAPQYFLVSSGDVTNNNVPEPSALLLLAFGCCSLSAVRRK